MKTNGSQLSGAASFLSFADHSVSRPGLQRLKFVGFVHFTLVLSLTVKTSHQPLLSAQGHSYLAQGLRVWAKLWPLKSDKPPIISLFKWVSVFWDNIRNCNVESVFPEQAWKVNDPVCQQHLGLVILPFFFICGPKSEKFGHPCTTPSLILHSLIICF